MHRLLEDYGDAWVCDPGFAIEGGFERVRPDAADGGSGRIFLECEAQPDLPGARETRRERPRDAQRDRADRAPGQEGLQDNGQGTGGSRRVGDSTSRAEARAGRADVEGVLGVARGQGESFTALPRGAASPRGATRALRGDTGVAGERPRPGVAKP